jgi:hypothetical protein
VRDFKIGFPQKADFSLELKDNFPPKKNSAEIRSNKLSVRKPERQNKPDFFVNQARDSWTPSHALSRV